MAQDHTPDDFDWVSAQAKCGAASMFERLRAGVKDDVHRRNGLLGEAMYSESEAEAEAED